MRDKVSKTFIQPEVVPPVHSNQVSEPMMSQLVGHCVGEIGVSSLLDFLLENVEIVESDQAGVLHSTPVVLGAENAVVFVEWERELEVVFVNFHGFVRNFEDKLTEVQSVGIKTLADIDRHGDIFPCFLGFDPFVVSSAKSEQISGEKFGLGEDCELVAFFGDV